VRFGEEEWNATGWRSVNQTCRPWKQDDGANEQLYVIVAVQEWSELEVNLLSGVRYKA
jgi:hypothetical protein